MSYIYLICPVRNRTKEDISFADDYVADLEEKGHIVHYPPRDVCQDDNGIGISICEQHRDAMLKAQECHVIWDVNSIGSHMDLGMAYVLQKANGMKIKLVNKVEKTSHKSYTNVLIELDKQEREKEAEYQFDEEDCGREWALPKDYYFCVAETTPVIPEIKEKIEEWFDGLRPQFTDRFVLNQKSHEFYLVPKYLFIEQKRVVLDCGSDEYMQYFGEDDVSLPDGFSRIFEYWEEDIQEAQRLVYDGDVEEGRKAMINFGFKEKPELAERCKKEFDMNTLYGEL